MPTKTIACALLLLPAMAVAQTSSTQARYDAASTQAKNSGKNDPDRVICRAALDTGSLVRRTKRCMTSAQWSERRRNENDSSRQFVRDNTGLVTGQ